MKNIKNISIKKIIGWGLLSILITISFTSCTNNEKYLLAKMDYIGYLNTVSTVYVEYNEADTTYSQVKNDLEEIKNILISIENTFSTEITRNMTSKSLLMEINDNAGVKPVLINNDFKKVIQKSIAMAVISNGYFDPTIGPLTKLWDVSYRASVCPKEYCDDYTPFKGMCSEPDPDDILKAKALIDYSKIQLGENDQGKSQIYLNSGMSLDLGAIAKGFAADKVQEFLKAQGYPFALINLGGNSLTYGESIVSPDFKTSIQNPFGIGTLVSFVKMNISVVTSGINERYYIYEDKYYHHLLNPFTGYPFENNIASVTILANTSIEADGYSTVVFALGVEKGIEFIKKTSGLDVVIITDDNNIHTTIDLTIEPGFENIVTIIKY